MKNLVIVLQQACSGTQTDMAERSTMIDSATAKKWECVTTLSNHVPIEFTAGYDAASGIGYLEFEGEKHYTESHFFTKTSTWDPPDVFVYVLNGRVKFFESGRNTRHIPARCVEL